MTLFVCWFKTLFPPVLFYSVKQMAGGTVPVWPRLQPAGRLSKCTLYGTFYVNPFYFAWRGFFPIFTKN
ncbi:hypothetical protein HMPREF3293_01822 [Christensenella minuta]|uniref:Uncharacterized protein n=1 Tax=Christensenella minuta TaxID=626937 RepID=A0A136Q3H1_9FIRM|nr:hypothetical protein HMPREF3293_01822 [Christensenella minuta]